MMKLSGAAILRLRAEQKLTLTDLAQKCGVSRATLSNITRGCPCSPVTAGKIADGLGVPVTEIMERKE